jgi:hypothetical protein
MIFPNPPQPPLAKGGRKGVTDATRLSAGKAGTRSQRGDARHLKKFDNILFSVLIPSPFDGGRESLPTGRQRWGGQKEVDPPSPSFPPARGGKTF